jgi:hypothetical protein
MLLFQRLGCGAERSIVPPIPCAETIEHELRRKVLPRPLEKEGKRGVAMWKGRGMRECQIKSVKFAEIGQMREIVAQPGPVLGLRCRSAEGR